MRRFDCSAIIFDLDGVLVDSTRFVERQWRRWATARGLQPEPFLRVCHGRRALETIRLAAPHLDAEVEVQAFLPQGDEEPPGPCQGADWLLRSLPAGSWGVATSGLRISATARLRQAGLPVPEVLVCAEDVARGKPSPDPYLVAAAGLGAIPEACLVIEDAPAGIEGARAAGMAVIALAATPSSDHLRADAWTASLRSVHVGRIDGSGQGRRLEILVVDSLIA